MKFPRDIYYRMRPGRFRVLKLLGDWKAVHGCAPTVRAMGEVLERSGACVHEHLQRLVRDGLVVVKFGKYATSRAGRKYLREVEK